MGIDTLNSTINRVNKELGGATSVDLGIINDTADALTGAFDLSGGPS